MANHCIMHSVKVAPAELASEDEQNSQAPPQMECAFSNACHEEATLALQRPAAVAMRREAPACPSRKHVAVLGKLQKGLQAACDTASVVNSMGRRSLRADSQSDVTQRTAVCAQFAVRETGRKADVLFVPSGLRLSSQKIVELVTKT